MRTALALVLLLYAQEAAAARLFTCGFEENDVTAFGTMWSAVVATAPSVVTTSPHSGTYAIETGTGKRHVSRQFGGTIGTEDKTTGTYYVRFYLYVSSFGTSTAFDDIFRAQSSGSVTGVSIALKSSTGELRAENDITATSQTFSTTLSTGTWYRIEGRLLISDTVGEWEVRLYTADSTTATETKSITAEDTLPTNYRTILSLGNHAATNMGTIRFDDTCVNDTSGSFQTTWCGPGKIYLTVPASDDTVTWTKNGAGCTGSTNFDCVNDLPGLPDDTTTYNDTASVQTDRYNTTAAPGEVTSSATFYVYDAVGRIGGSSTTGTNTGRLSVWNDSGSESNGTTAAFCDTTTWRFMSLSEHLALDLAGKTKTQVDSYDIGAEPVSLAQTCRLTALWANVEWLEAPACAGSPIALLGAGCK